jgi:hypothetical protein
MQCLVAGNIVFSSDFSCIENITNKSGDYRQPPHQLKIALKLLKSLEVNGELTKTLAFPLTVGNGTNQAHKIENSAHLSAVCAGTVLHDDHHASNQAVPAQLYSHYDEDGITHTDSAPHQPEHEDAIPAAKRHKKMGGSINRFAILFQQEALKPITPDEKQAFFTPSEHTPNANGEAAEAASNSNEKKQKEKYLFKM